MSFWIYRKQPNGQRIIYLVEFPILTVIVVIGLLAALVLPRYLNQPSRLYTDSAVLISIGFILVLLAKIHLISRGIMVSWGSSLMTRPYRVAYKTGYVLLIIGTIIILTLLIKI